MKQEIYKAPAAALLCLLREIDGQTQILLQKRGEGIWAAGWWDAAAGGKADEDESIVQCLVREAQEEIGVSIDPVDIEFVHVQHGKNGGANKIPSKIPIFFNFFFFVRKWTGTPKICESDKCDALEWFDIDNLPENTISNRVAGINAYKNGIHFGEFGWER